MVYGLWSVVNEKGPKGPSGKVSGPKGPFTANGEGPKGPSGKVSGPFTTNERAQRGPSGKVLFACFVFHISLYLRYLYYALHSIFDNATGPFWAPGGP